MRRPVGRRPVYPGDGHIDRRIIFGPAGDPARTLAELGQPLPSSPLGSHFALIADGTPGFRLSSPGWANLTARDLALATSGDRLYQLVREKLVAKLPTFSVRLHLFVEKYLDDAKRRANETFGGNEPDVFGPEDWIYSAFLPLPNARVKLPGDNSGTPQFAEISVLFWTGNAAIGVQLEPRSSVIGSRKKNLEELSAAWPELNLIGFREIACRPIAMASQPILPAFPPRIWEGMGIPQGPSLSGVFESPLTEQIGR